MKAKALFITLLLSLSAVSLWAQEKYELATVSIGGSGMIVATSGEVKTTPIPKGINQESVQLRKVEEMISEGWEVYNTTTVGLTYNVYFLRKKKN